MLANLHQPTHLKLNPAMTISPTTKVPMPILFAHPSPQEPTNLDAWILRAIHLRLEHLDDLEFTSTFELEAFELRERPVVIENSISLLEELSLLRRRWKHHATAVKHVEMECRRFTLASTPLAG